MDVEDCELYMYARRISTPRPSSETRGTSPIIDGSRRSKRSLTYLDCTHRSKGRLMPNYDQLESICMTIDHATEKTIYRRPGVFSVRKAGGYFETDIVRK